MRKLTCEGEIFPTEVFAIPLPGAYNFGSVGNTVYGNTGFEGFDILGDIQSYDICTGLPEGEVQFCEDPPAASDWGFYIDPRTDKFYATASGNLGANYLWVFDENDFDTDDATCIDAVASLPAGQIWGVVTDVDENIYIAMLNDGNGHSFVLKYDSDYNFDTTSPIDSVNGDGGWNRITGLTYSEASNLIYASAASNNESCVTSFSTDLQTVTEVVPPAGSSQGKAIGLTSECCPGSNRQTIDQIYCISDTAELIFLNELYDCKGIICASDWGVQSIDAGLNYDPCSQGLKATQDGCATFYKSSDGLAGNCGAFEITMNIEFILNVPAVLPDTTLCLGNDFTIVPELDENATNVTYQWQTSTTCEGIYTDIVGATDMTYTATATADTAYYRLVTTAVGDCAGGDCAEVSNCATVITESCFFDLALAKTLSSGQSPYVGPGDVVSFDITVSNQDSVTTAYNVLVNDYVPAGYSFDDTLPANAGWNTDSDGDGSPDYTIAGPLAPGTDTTLTIELTIADSFTGTQDDLVNYAEIASFEDVAGNSSLDSTIVDIDSAPDNDPDNDAGGTPGGDDDDYVDGDGTGVPGDGVDTTDEDDADPAFVTIFDLALAKTLSAGQSPYIAPGDEVSFDIVVTNQGTVAAYDVLVNDYVPAGYTFDATLNTAWSADSDADGNPDQTIAGPLAPGASMTLTIVLSVNDPFTSTQADLVNYAEISAADDDEDDTNTPPTDADSTPDTVPGNDPGGTPDGADDDFIDGDGLNGGGAPLDGTAASDEDDQDPAYVSIFDLALVKTLSAGQSPYIAPGDEVSFDIVVTNQGTVAAYDVLVNDYVPAGYTFDATLNTAWSADSDADGNPDQTIAGPLAPGTSMTLTIVLSVNDPFTGTQDDLVNYAEIGSFEDILGNSSLDSTIVDIDSAPDNDTDNDAGGTPDGDDDDYVDGDGTGVPGDGVATTDEDDADPAFVTIFDLALTKALAPGQSAPFFEGNTIIFDIILNFCIKLI